MTPGDIVFTRTPRGVHRRVARPTTATALATKVLAMVSAAATAGVLASKVLAMVRPPAVAMARRVCRRAATSVTATVLSARAPVTGFKVYTHLSDRYGPFYTKLIAATASAALHVRDQEF